MIEAGIERMTEDGTAHKLMRAGPINESSANLTKCFKTTCHEGKSFRPPTQL